MPYSKFSDVKETLGQWLSCLCIRIIHGVFKKIYLFLGLSSKYCALIGRLWSTAVCQIFSGDSNMQPTLQALIWKEASLRISLVLSLYENKTLQGRITLSLVGI